MLKQQMLMRKAQRQHSDTLFHLGAASTAAAVLIIIMTTVHGMHTVVYTQLSLRENAAKLAAQAQPQALPVAKCAPTSVRMAQTKPLEGV